MANEDQLRIIRQGVEAWNKWRKENPDQEIDLSEANLGGVNLGGMSFSDELLILGRPVSGAEFYSVLQNIEFSGQNILSYVIYSSTDIRKANLIRANLSKANLIGANLIGAILIEANLSEANLSEAILGGTNLSAANLIGANLNKASLIGANLFGANLTDTNLAAADLSRASLIKTTFVRTKLTGCRIYGISAWELKFGEEIEQKDLIITPYGKPTITVDDLEVAQFIYFLLHNPNFRRVIDTMTSKAVLILGRFSDDRKPTLYAIKDELRKHGYVPIIYDFEGSTNRTTEETITLIARLARFVIADITEPKSIIQEISSITKELPSVPIKPILLEGHEPWSMYDHPKRYPWLLPLYKYQSTEKLISSFKESVLDPLEGWLKENLKSAQSNL